MNRINYVAADGLFYSLVRYLVIPIIRPGIKRTNFCLHAKNPTEENIFDNLIERAKKESHSI